MAKRKKLPTKLKQLMAAGEWSAQSLAAAASEIGPEQIGLNQVRNLMARRPVTVLPWHHQVASVLNTTVDEIFSSPGPGRPKGTIVVKRRPAKSPDQLEAQLAALAKIISGNGHDGKAWLDMGRKALASQRLWGVSGE